MSARWAFVIILMGIFPAAAQEIALPKGDIPGQLELAKKTGALYDTTLPALLTKEGTRKCEYFQFRVDCLDIAVPKRKLVGALNGITRSFARRSLPEDEGINLLHAYVEGEVFKRKTTVKFAVVAPPVPPAIPFV